ncbi:MAG: glycoside hydrolase family 31 protein [Bacteroidaceae bacterium]|nr:glycoside hydrolase family 31 protein [Bacteroidaceae bacterium]
MKRKAILFSILALMVNSIWAQKVEFFTPSIVRIIKDNGQPFERKSEVITAKPQKVKISKSVDGDITTYRSSALTVTVEKGRVTFADRKGNVLLREGECKFTPITSGVDKGAYKVKQSFALDKDEPIYGLGLLQNGKMSQRGEHRLMMQSNLEDYSNVFQSIKGYGIYWDNYSPTQIDDNATLELESQVGKAVDYYFMYGVTADGVIAQMRYLSGKVPMSALWTYGFHQSRERYKSQNELLDVVRKYRKLRVPFDGIIQDWQYWGSNYTWNAMEFLNEDFGRAQQMIDEVHRQNAHMSISIWSSFGPETKAFKELKDKGLLFSFKTWPESGLGFWPPRMDYPSGVRCYDVYSLEARDIYWKNLSRLHKMGIDAWWMDSTDPDHMSFKDSDLDETCSVGSYRSVRNIFPLKAVSGVYDHQRAVDSSKRVFILTRSYFAGQQRTGAQTWSGDIGSSWENFRKQIPICLNYTLTANPNVNTDIGGFFAGSYNTQGHNSATRNPQYQELYVRWMQFGAFTPMMRSHGTDVYRELYYYGKQGEPVYDALVNAVKLRYNFLPYIYSTAWQVSKNDDSFMRALMMDFKSDRNTWDNSREFMFGRNILVCPVLSPLYTKEKIVKTDELSGWNKTESQEANAGYPNVNWTEEKQYEVYLPAGTQWFDFWTEKKIEGGQNVMATVPLDHSPLYVKAGSIIPLGPDVQYANENKFDNIDIVVYPGANAEFMLYEDEGDNYNYEKGQYSTILLKWNDKAKVLTIGKRKGSFQGMLASRTFNVKVVGGKNTTVKYSGKSITVK